MIGAVDLGDIAVVAGFVVVAFGVIASVARLWRTRIGDAAAAGEEDEPVPAMSVPVPMAPSPPESAAEELPHAPPATPPSPAETYEPAAPAEYDLFYDDDWASDYDRAADAELDPGPAPAPVPEAAAPDDRVGGSGAGGSQGGSAPPPVERTLVRTPHLDAPSAVPTATDDAFHVTVRLNMEDYEPGESGETLRIDLPAGVDRVILGVLLTPSVHFHVDNPYAPLPVEVGQREVELPPIEVRVVAPTEDEPDQAGITALFVYNGRACGSVTRRWRWNRAHPTAPVIIDTEAELSAMHIGLTDEQPALTVYVTRPTNDGINFQVSIETPLLPEYSAPTESEPWALPELARTFVAAQIDRIMFGDNPEQRRIALLAAGVAFWEAAPRVFQDVLWQLIANETPPRNIFIASEEPALPWELMIPSHVDDDGIVQDREPLGVEFPIGRWVANVGRPKQQRVVPNLRIAVSRSWVVAPTYKMRSQIDAKAETEFLQQRLNGALAQPASEADLDRRFGETPAELVHFVCHGETTPDADVLIMDDETRMSAMDVRVRNGFKALCRQARPLIFINACNAGNLTPAIGGATGFPKTFGDLGARAIIAPLWSVTDTKAGPIAVELYRRALHDSRPTLGELVRDIRARAYHDPEFDDSFAAYCLFGDPLLTLEATPAPGPVSPRPPAR